MSKSDFDELQNRLGYAFSNVELLRIALTHSSYVNEHQAIGNERIEFLGDCVLNFAVGEKLYYTDTSASEGKLSARRAAMVSRAPLARIVDSLGLVNYLVVGAGVDKSAFSEKARSDIFEAVLGAIYIDGGLEACRRVLEKVYYKFVEPERDYKNELILYVNSIASGGVCAISYDTAECDGGFESVVHFAEREYRGFGHNKRTAQIAAARAALQDLRGDNR